MTKSLKILFPAYVYFLVAAIYFAYRDYSNTHFWETQLNINIFNLLVFIAPWLILIYLIFNFVFTKALDSRKIFLCSAQLGFIYGLIISYVIESGIDHSTFYFHKFIGQTILLSLILSLASGLISIFVVFLIKKFIRQ